MNKDPFAISDHLETLTNQVGYLLMKLGKNVHSQLLTSYERSSLLQLFDSHGFSTSALLFAIRRQPESNMDFQQKHRPGSGKQVFCIEKYTQGNREFSSSPKKI